MSYSSDPVLDASRHFDALYDKADAYDAALQIEIAILEKQALKDAERGDFDKLLTAVDYDANDTAVMKALFAAKAAGVKEAAEIIKTLAFTYASTHAEVL